MTQRKPKKLKGAPQLPQPGKAVEQPKTPMSEPQKRLIADFLDRTSTRHAAPRVKVEHHPPEPVTIRRFDDEPQTAVLAELAAFGTTSSDFYDRIFRDLIEVACRGSSSQPVDEKDVNGALAAMHGIAPRDEAEGMLAAQMVIVHSAIIKCMRQFNGSDLITQQDSNGNLLVKLLRTYAIQLEALQRYRGKGQQKVTVEHVHVNDGGQAIVGAV